MKHIIQELPRIPRTPPLMASMITLDKMYYTDKTQESYENKGLLFNAVCIE